MKTRTTVILSFCGLAAVCSVIVGIRVLATGDEPRAKTETLRKVDVEHVYSGHKVKLDTGEELIYAGIRSPYPHEPMHDESLERNTELVGDETIRIRFDKAKRNRRGKLIAYVTADGKFINELLVREGLAYVRLTPETRRFAAELLAAQAEARREKRGLWQTQRQSSRNGYAADPKYGNFHKLNCEEVDRMKPERRVDFRNKDQALDRGFAPCESCRP